MRLNKTYRITAILISIVLAAGILTGCNASNRVTASQPMNGEKLVKEYEDMVKLKELDPDFLFGQRSFAYGIFDELNKEENIVISPYSISLALSMLYNGADLETREEMAKVLGYHMLENYTANYNAEVNHYMNANNQLLMERMKGADGKVEINLANSIWLSKQGEYSDSLEEALLAPVRYYYDGDIFDVDFAEDQTLKDVNAWVSDKTEGMIDPFLDSFQNPESLRVFLANAVYFNGKWSIPFQPKDTSPRTFYGVSSQAEVDMMYLHKEEFRYFTEGLLKGIELPYGGGRLVMNILMPAEPEKDTILDIYKKMNLEEVDFFLDNLDRAPKIDISTVGIPKFELEYGMENLNDELISLGIEQAFRESEADFNLIGKDLFVSRVGHKAKIEVEEWGTKASAVTGIEVDTTSAELEPMLFIADVPFLFLIRDTVTDTILFMGQYIQP